MVVDAVEVVGVGVGFGPGAEVAVGGVGGTGNWAEGTDEVLETLPASSFFFSAAAYDILETVAGGAREGAGASGAEIVVLARSRDTVSIDKGVMAIVGPDAVAVGLESEAAEKGTDLVGTEVGDVAGDDENGTGRAVGAGEREGTAGIEVEGATAVERGVMAKGVEATGFTGEGNGVGGVWAG